MSYQIPPRYYGYWAYYNQGFADITECRHCGATGLYEDCHPNNPCRFCGGQVLNVGAGRWVKPVYKGFLWWRKKVSGGYWERSTANDDINGTRRAVGKRIS